MHIMIKKLNLDAFKHPHGSRGLILYNRNSEDSAINNCFKLVSSVLSPYRVTLLLVCVVMNMVI